MSSLFELKVVKTDGKQTWHTPGATRRIERQATLTCGQATHDGDQIINSDSELIYAKSEQKNTQLHRYVFVPNTTRHFLISANLRWALDEVVNGVAIAADHAERRGRRVVLVRVPENVDLLEGGAGDGVPVSLGVGNRWNTGAVGGTADRPAGLGNPHPLAWRNVIHSSAGSIHRLPEGVAGISDGRALEVWVTVHADEVCCSDDSVVGAVDPGGLDRVSTLLAK